MGQKVSPIGFRTGVTIGWKSRWFAPKSNFGEFLVEDAQIRNFIDQRLNRQPPYAAISAIEIERTREEVKVSLKTARPGLVIGPKGQEVDKLKAALEDLTDRRVNVNIIEIKNPDLDARLVAEGIAEQLKRRSSFRRALKQRAEASIQAGAKGVKICISGRLGGADMSRQETKILGSIPLHTLEADVDYAFVPCFTTYGTVGVKVWVYRGLFGEQASEEEAPVGADAMTRGRRRRERGGGGGGGGRSRRGPQQTVSHAQAPHSRTKPAAAPEPAPASEPAPAPEPTQDAQTDTTGETPAGDAGSENS